MLKNKKISVLKNNPPRRYTLFYFLEDYKIFSLKIKFLSLSKIDFFFFVKILIWSKIEISFFLFVKILIWSKYQFGQNNNLVKISIWSKTSFFSLKMEILSKFFIKIKFENHKDPFSSQNENFVKNRQFCQKCPKKWRQY